MSNKSHLKSLLTNFIKTGSNPEESDDVNRRTLITNVMVCVAIFFSIIFQFQYLYYRWYYLQYVTFFMLFIYVAVFIFNWKGFGQFATVFYFLALIFQLTVNSSVFLSADSGIHFFLMAIPPMVLLSISERSAMWRFFMIILPVIAFLFVEYFPWRSPLDVHAPMFNLHVMHMLSTTGTISAVTFAVYIFFLDFKKTKEDLAYEHKKSELLLLNILPKSIADRLKVSQENIADVFPHTSILFADIVGFTQLSTNMSPDEVVSLLNRYFSAYDDLTEKHRVEKIKTIGDAYMVAAGIPSRCSDHADTIMNMAIDMLEVTNRISRELHQDLRIRIGINSGQSTAGIIGKKKFIYDLWGDTVNIASRMESHGESGKIQVAEGTYQLLKDKYAFEFRGEIEVKGKGKLKTYFLKL